MKKPVSTYRLQIRESLTLQDAAGLVDYIRRLGADWVYLSPILTAEKGSDHGYDVTDPTSVDESRGGPSGLEALSAAARAAGLGVLVDIVPNHQGVATPADNPWWWSLLKEGRQSRYAEAFDVDWDFGGGKVRIPVLGDGEHELDELKIVDGELRYYDNRYPIADGTADDGASPVRVHERQHYELVNWRREDAELNYRRFFGVSSLAGVKVEVPWVFDESHAEIGRWIDEGLVDGLRVDHPDGLADPAGYLERLRELARGGYVLIEKILEPGEELPAGWACDGTTGYDALADVDRLFTDPAGQAALDALDGSLREGTPADYHSMIHGTKRGIADGILRSEVLRLARLVPADAGLAPETAADALAELLACFPVYRSYLPEGAAYLEEAGRLAAEHRPDLAGALQVLLPLLAGQGRTAGEPLGELATRFQQTSGMVMAKGVEDTAFYRYTRLTSLNEVGADPSVFALAPAEFHDRQRQRLASAPHSMTTLSTHDTKRSEDVRARINVLSEIPGEWAQTLSTLDAAAPLPDGPLSNLLWQAIIGAWPLSRERAHAYAEKAAREAGNSTRWTAPNEEFEAAMHRLVDAAYDNEEVSRTVGALVNRIRAAGWSNSLSAKLVQLTMPGVPDVYQGSEFWEDSLVDPDNRRRVDFEARRTALEQIDAGALPAVGPDAKAKLLVTSAALRLRRDSPSLFTGYEPLTAAGPETASLLAFDRGGAITVATRLPLGLERRGGWARTSLDLPYPVTDVLTRNRHDAGTVLVRDLLATYPVALLARSDAAAPGAANDPSQGARHE
ncbi:malto-oligosyltrehalose synthase [Paenarthrobacter sp. DKR-5]|uniref:malto-oligosyltrehalose synthase n=1 Tax=Paenarthrobacter sp. DKR-5 TaxID=2835535 RepID=UPI001BDC7C45|nr:malto-oligosyltrehalose synthase [Paenarthrobacter sp. DKR-5]MBT1004297.1 malto-oligosyltrehalose synthase [Paenarthrobacter sp. DKR-5]